MYSDSKGVRGVQFHYQDSYVPASGVKRGTIQISRGVCSNSSRAKVVHLPHQEGYVPAAIGLCSSSSWTKWVLIQYQQGCVPTTGGQKSYNSNMTGVVFQHQGGKRGSIPVSREICSNSSWAKSVQIQHQDGYVSTARGHKGYNSNIKRGLFQE